MENNNFYYPYNLYIILILLCINLWGCAVGGLTTYSRLIEKNSADEELYIYNNLVHLPGLTFSIRPDNNYANMACIGVILPIIPLGFQVKPEKSDSPFHLLFEFETEKTGFTVNPNKIFLCYQNNKYSPAKMSACYRGEPYSGSYRPAGVPPGRDWGCDYKTYKIDENGMFNSIESVQLLGKTSQFRGQYSYFS
ncbi:MAG: hypothetical protein SWH61_13720 [Thermodesulfobacteriota bacterium]|nr:hypothetical protein [Thermodesulfobacteriota bacterium]